MKRRSTTQKEQKAGSDEEEKTNNTSSCEIIHKKMLDELSDINRKTSEKMFSSLIRSMNFLETKLDKLDLLDSINLNIDTINICNTLRNIDLELDTIHQRLDDQLYHMKELQKHYKNELKAIQPKLSILDELKNLINEVNDDDEEKSIKNIINRPQCLYCLGDFNVNTKIAQCINGHLICFQCKERSNTGKCGLCKEPMEGRAFSMERHIENLNKIDVIIFCFDKLLNISSSSQI